LEKSPTEIKAHLKLAKGGNPDLLGLLQCKKKFPSEKG